MKTDLLLRQTRLRLPAFSEGEIEIHPIEKVASDRRFYRVRCSSERSLILVKYNRALEENRQYARAAEFLGEHKIRGPRIYFHDPDEGLIWMEDLGASDLFSFRANSWMVRGELYRSALDEIAKMHELPESSWASLRGAMPPEFDAALYQWEQNYFFENCLGRIFGLPEKERAKLARLPGLQEISQQLAAQPRVLVHRDFQSQNIILRHSHAYLIDFQGMRPGLAEYDVASLLFDPYVRLSADERSELFSYYLDRRLLSGETKRIETLLRHCAVQRLMQALGAYGFLSLVKGTRRFLAYVPAALDSLGELIATIPPLKPLGAAIATLPTNIDVG